MRIWNEIQSGHLKPDQSVSPNQYQNSLDEVGPVNTRWQQAGLWNEKVYSIEARSVRCLFDHVGGEGVVTGNADGVAGQRVGVPPGGVAAGNAEVA